MSGSRWSPRTLAERVLPGTARLDGLTLPGLANAHSHAFHRALRGGPAGSAAAGSAGTAGGDTFWTWRERMYAVAERLDPGSYFALARAVYAEMALAGVTCVGEFHYLHHGPEGKPYSDPNEVGRVLIAAAAAAGLRITLLDACYLAGGCLPGGETVPLSGVQLRFGDGSAAAWAERVSGLGCDARGMVAPHAHLGAAIHSIRAVPPDQVPEVMAWSHAHAAPVHAHLSEQPLENAECRAAFGATPAEVLYEAGAIGPRSTMVHATHLTDRDILTWLGVGSQLVCGQARSTEADPRSTALWPRRPRSLPPDRRSRLAATGTASSTWLRRPAGLSCRSGWWPVARSLHPGRPWPWPRRAAGHACLGWSDAGEREFGAYADLVTVSLDSPRLAGAPGSDPLAALFAAGTSADIRHVVASGVDVVRDGRHLLVDDVPGELAAAITAALG